MGKVYAVSDLHGVYPLWAAIQSYLQPDDKIFVLGDCGDRCSEGWRIIKEVLRDPRAIYVRGNHDQMLLDSWRDEWYGSDYHIWMSNGGYPTFDSLMCDEKQETYLIELSKTKLYYCYVNKEGQRIHLSHAGFTLMENDEIPNRDDLLWDREHIADFCSWWPSENPTDYVVHGHTPVLSSTFKSNSAANPQGFEFNENKTVVRYAHGHKICIDGGAFKTGRCALLDLDTLQEIEFKVEFIPY